MKTDTDAIAVYFEAWKPGDPLPSCLAVLDHNGTRFVFDDTGQDIDYADPDLAESLTGVLVVELARLRHRVVLFESHPNDGVGWYAARHLGDDKFREVGGRLHFTPLCALVAAWREVNK